MQIDDVRLAYDTPIGRAHYLGAAGLLPGNSPLYWLNGRIVALRLVLRLARATIVDVDAAGWPLEWKAAA